MEVTLSSGRVVTFGPNGRKPHALDISYGAIENGEPPTQDEKFEAAQKINEALHPTKEN